MKERYEAQAEIDAIDAELLRLFEQRMRVSAKIAAYKRERGLPVRDAAGEAALLARSGDAIEDPDIAG